MLNKRPSLAAKTGMLLLLASCSGTGRDQQNLPADSSGAKADTQREAKAHELTRFKYDKLISNTGIPFDILRTTPEAALPYTAEAVNPPSNLSFYSSSYSKALNLGVYGGDLAYSITYEKFDEMGRYLKCAKKLADDLGIPLAFDQGALASYKEYETNRDSLEKIVFTSYSEVNKTLSSNERIGLASLVVTGGWVEGIFATLKSLGNRPKDDKTRNIYKKILEQKNNLNMILELLSQFKDEIAYVNLVIDLSSIESVYDHLAMQSDISEKEISSLYEKVSLVRSKIIAH